MIEVLWEQLEILRIPGHQPLVLEIVPQCDILSKEFTCFYDDRYDLPYKEVYT